MASSAVIDAGGGLAPATAGARRSRLRRRVLAVLLGLGIRLLGGDRGRVGRRLAGLLHLLDFRQHLVERALHRVDAASAPGGRSLSAVARATSSSPASARIASSARRASRITASCASTRARSAVAASSAARSSSRSASSAPDVVVERRARRRRSPAAAPRGARASARARRRARRCAARARARPPRAARLRPPAPTRARPAPRASARASAALRAELRRPRRARRPGGAARRPAARPPAAARPRARPIDASASARRASSAARSSSACRRSSAITSALRASRARVLAGARELRLVRDDRLLLAMLLGLQRRRSRDVACAIVSSSCADVRRRAAPAPRVGRDALAQLLDLAPRRQDAARLDLGAAGHQVRPAQHVALERRDRRRRLRARTPPPARRCRRRRPRAAPSGSSTRAGPDTRSTSATGTMPGHAQRLARVIAVRARIDDDEAAAAGVVLADERQARRRLLVALDDDVLQQVAEAGFDRALVAAVDVEVVGHRALLADVAVGLHEHHARRVAELGAARRELLERRQPRLDAGQLLLARRARRARATRARARAVASSDSRARALEPRRARAPSARARSASAAAARSASTVSRLAAQIVLLDVELAERLADALVLRRRVLHRVPQRGRPRSAPRTPRSAPPRRRLRALRSAAAPAACSSLRRRQHRRGLVARALGLGAAPAGAPRARCRAGSRRASRSRSSSPISVAARGERLGLLAVELQLLLPAVDVELAGVRVLADRATRGCRPRPARCAGAPRSASTSATRAAAAASRSRASASRVRAVSMRLRQLAIAAGEQHLLPAPQLVAQPLVAARLRRLALQRAALLLDLEDDVVDAREVLLRRLELQLGGAAARLVLGDAGGFLDQLAPVGRPRAEDHADLALLDDRVGLGAEPGVHQQLVHVAQPAHFAVDQVFALARAVQAPRDFDVARERVGELLEIVAWPLPLPLPLPLPCAVAVAVAVAVRRRGTPVSAATSATGVAGVGGGIGRPVRRSRTSAARPACARRCR